MTVTLMEMMAAMVVTVTMIVSGRIVGCSRRKKRMMVMLMTTMMKTMTVMKMDTSEEIDSRKK